MTRPKAGDGADRTFQVMVSVSLVLHLAAVVIPGSWWRAALAGRPGEFARSDGFVVSLVELPEAGETQTTFPVSQPQGVVPPLPEVEASVPDPEPEPPTDLQGTTPIRSPTNPAKPETEDSPEGTREGSAGNPEQPPGLPGNEGASEAEDGEQIPFQGPRLLAPGLPIDPENAESLEVPHEIPVRLLIGTDGKVEQIHPLLELSEPVLQAVENSARAMRFHPARRGTEPVVAWFSMTFVYNR